MKTKVGILLPFLLLPALSSCGGQKRISPIFLDLGSVTIFDTASDAAKKPYTDIAYSKLKSLIAQKANFLFLARGSSDTCACWHDFSNKCLTPYVKAKRLLVYGMDVSALEKEEDHFKIPLFDGYDTVAVFEEGKLVHSKSYAEDEKFGTDAPTFNAWMDERIRAPKVYAVNENQLNRLYEGTDPFEKATSRFALTFGRDSCPDCQFVFRHDFREYFTSRESATLPLYYFDFDLYKGTDSYDAKKVEYGLMADKEHPEENPYAYETGAFPAILSIIPNGGEKIETIDQFGIFYNDKITEGKITDTYFTAARMGDPITGTQGASSYCQNVSPNVLEGRSVDATKTKNEALQPYHQPLVNAILDEIL